MKTQHEEMVTAAADLMEATQGELTAASMGLMLSLLDDLEDNLHLLTTATKALS